jgi:hypothetical protein
LFDYWITLHDTSLFPAYYRAILVSRSYPGYSIQMLWADGESDAFEMTPIGST